MQTKLSFSQFVRKTGSRSLLNFIDLRPDFNLVRIHAVLICRFTALAMYSVVKTSIIKWKLKKYRYRRKIQKILHIISTHRDVNETVMKIPKHCEEIGRRREREQQNRMANTISNDVPEEKKKKDNRHNNKNK